MQEQKKEWDLHYVSVDLSVEAFAQGPFLSFLYFKQTSLPSRQNGS